MNDARHVLVVLAFVSGVILTLIWAVYLAWTLIRCKRSSFPTLFKGGRAPEDVSRIDENGSHIWLTI